MKISAIKKLILEKKRVTILTGQRGQQWIGGDNWMIRVDDGITIGPDSIKGLFDLDVEQMEKIAIEEAPMEGHPMYPELKAAIEQMATGPLLIGNYGGVEMLGFQGDVYLLEDKYIRAAVSRDDYRDYLLARNVDGEPLIVIRDGLVFAGIARPMPVAVCANLIKNMAAIADMRPRGAGEQPEEAPEGPEEQGKIEGTVQLDMTKWRHGENE